MKVNTSKLLFSMVGFLGLLLGTVGATTIVEFNFENSDKRGTGTINTFMTGTNDYTADDGIVGNINISKIRLLSGANFSGFTQVGGNYHPTSTGRNSGSGIKHRMIKFSTLGHTGLQLSSKQRSSNTGPRDFKLQYSTGGVIWINLTGSDITVVNNFTSGVLSGIFLPSVLSNQPHVYLRWIMRSDTSVNGGINGVQPAGTSRIDDIVVEGTINQYTVTFQDRDNSFLSSGSVNHGSDAIAPTDPTRTGYTFSGWDTPFNNITGATTITALYNVDQYLVTFEDYNGTVLSTGLVNYSSGATAPTAPTRTGYTFSGWDAPFNNITGATTITAQYNINSYTVTFQDRDNSFLSSGSVNYSSGATAPTDPTRTGYTFSGWDMPFNNITGATTITAQYNINQYTITYTPGANGYISGSDSQTINYGSNTSTVTAVPNTGYNFVNRSDGNTNTSRIDTVTGNITYTANFSLIIPGGPTTGTTSGGGGGYTLPQDNCPNGDKSPSYYDGTCEKQTPPQVDPNIFNPSFKNTCFTPIDKKTIDQHNNINQAFKIAHQMLYSYGLTTWQGTQDYRPYDYLTRAEAAKFMVEFAQNVLCRTTGRSYDNNFSDIAGTDSSLLPFIQKAYEYNIFNGDHNDATSLQTTTFRPTDRINNDELTAIIVRLVTNSILEESLGGNWAEPYIAQLNDYTTQSSLDESGRGNIAEVLYDVYRNNTYQSNAMGYVIQ